MPMLIITIAGWFGINPLRLVAYAAVVAAVVVGGLMIRQHYVNLGWNKAIVAVKKQDDRAVAAADKAQQKADQCQADSWWDVISQSCKTEDAQ